MSEDSTDLSGFQTELGEKEVSVLFGENLVSSDGEELFGDADIFTRIVRVDSSDPAKEQLDTLIHECLHIAFPWLREWMVAKVATQLAHILYLAGWRHTYEESKPETNNGGPQCSDN